MSLAIEHTLKEAGFTDGQVKVLTPVFEAVQVPASEKTLAFQVAEVKGKFVC